jgi:hypothetical protein
MANHRVDGQRVGWGFGIIPEMFRNHRAISGAIPERK